MLQADVAGIQRLGVIRFLNQLPNEPGQIGFADQDLFDEQSNGVPRLLIFGISHFAKDHRAFKLDSQEPADWNGFGQPQPYASM